MTTIYLVRHGETIWNTERRFQGQQDVPLNEVGQRQARLIAGALAQRSLDAVYTSDLQRAVATAEAIATPHGLAPITDIRLRERCAGIWEGLTHAEVEQHWPESIAAWRTNTVTDCADGAETYDALCSRMAEVVQDVLHRHPNGNIAIVSHAGSLRTLITFSLQLPVTAFFRMHMENGSISTLRTRDDGTLILAGLNDTCHLTQ